MDAPKFTDRTGREWVVELNNGMLPELKAIGLDLSQFTREEQATELTTALGRLLLDPETLGQVLWVLVDEQAEAARISPAAFARGLNADALSAATDAVMVAVFDHVFRREEFRRLMRAVVPKLWAKAEADMRAKLTGP